MFMVFVLITLVIWFMSRNSFSDSMEQPSFSSRIINYLENVFDMSEGELVPKHLDKPSKKDFRYCFETL